MTLMQERPIVTDGTTTSPGFKGLLETLDELHVPDGFSAEIIRGSIVVSPWSKGYYLDVMDVICDQLRSHLPEGHRISQAPALYTFPSVERAYGPDIHAAHRRARGTTSNCLDGESLSFVAELTSPSTRENDCTDKVREYGRAGVPVYLLLDMQEELATVFSSPTVRGYAATITVPFGEKVRLPEPFDCELDTAGFTAPDDEES
ncbi:Uma2 family endonuclease [Streptomyces sp. NPDC048442]|uniref:Uma2 family endonuclease n=1 Tax=Streptomyces sp. NPDC048442 TaxID=3154823 RepID=UPI003421A58E